MWMQSAAAAHLYGLCTLDSVNTINTFMTDPQRSKMAKITMNCAYLT